MLGKFNKDVYETTYQQLVERMNSQVETTRYNKENPSMGRYGTKKVQNSRQV